MRRVHPAVLVVAGLVFLISVKGIASTFPYGMLLFWAMFFACLKPLMGMRTWWHPPPVPRCFPLWL